ncbi:MAG: hypothetical protein ACOVMI_07330 [Chitinophagaceae bacterium]
MLTKTDIEKYFIAEKQESLVFLIIGIIAIILALIGLFASKNGIYKGASIPLILIALIQITVGFTIYKRSDADRTRVVYAYDMAPNDLKSKELVRMQIVNKNFVIYRYVEIALAIVGIALVIFFKPKLGIDDNWGSNKFWFGLGIALALQALIMLGADYFAEKRALMYTKLLQEFVNK